MHCKSMCIHHRWELPGNYLDFIVVMVFYLFCCKTKRILVTLIIDFKIYILIQSLILFIQENNWVICFESTMAHFYIYILIKIIICNGNLFSCSRFYAFSFGYSRKYDDEKVSSEFPGGSILSSFICF